MPTPRYTFFLAHAGADEARARELYNLLRSHGVSTFLDVVDVLPGDEWDRKLAEAQRGALATVALVSNAADDAYYLRNEIAAGIAYQRAEPEQHRLIPVFLDGRPTDAAQIPYGLHIKHALDARILGDLPSVAQELGRVAAILQDQATPSTPPLVRRAADRIRLYQALCGLGDKEFEELMFLVSPQVRDFAPPQAARPFRARNVVQWAEVQGEATYRLVLDHALKLTPWLAWLEYRRKESALVHVPGPDKEVAFDAGDLVVPLQLQLHPRGIGDDPATWERDGGRGRSESITGTYHDAFRVVEQRSLCFGFAIVGDPGSGKTTLLQQIYREAHENGTRALGLRAELTPVFVRCRAFERVERVDWSFPTLLEAQAAADGYAGAATALFAAKRPLLLLFDGLDEVRDEDTRGALCAWLGQQALVHRDDWRFVVTSRIATWQRESRLSEDHFLTTDVQELDEATIRRYVALWFGVVRRREWLNEREEKIEADAHSQARALLDQLYPAEPQRDPNLLKLMRNPLSLALLCQVHTRHAKLPVRRGRLYDACLTVFLERRPREQARPYLPARAARLVLQPLSWWMQSQAVDELPRKQIERRVARALHGVPELAAVSPAAFVRTAANECGLLRSLDFESLGFFHAALREYLAAAHAVERRLFGKLLEHADDDRWRNVIALAMSIERGFSGLARAFLDAGIFARHSDRFVEGLRQATSVEIRPFVNALTEAKSEDVLAILRLFEGRREPRLWAAARLLQEHPDERVRKAIVPALALVEPARAASADGPAPVEAPEPGALWREPITGITLVWIPPGEFWMGSSKTRGQPNYDANAYVDELPPRRVRLTYGFWMAQHPVTNEVYGRFLAAAQHREPDYWRNARYNKPEQPVVGVSFDDAVAFCEWATKAGALEAGRQIDLPTEPEWEYTARAAGGDGPARRYPWGGEEPTLERAVFGGADLAAVGGRPTGATPLGVHDMAGNVLEWCLSPWGKYPNEPPEVDVDPWPSPPSAAPRVVRGGSWGGSPLDLRAAYRNWNDPGDRHLDLGFRVVCRGSRQHVDH